MSRRQVTVHYRRLEDVNGAFNGQTLEAAIRSAMQHPHGETSVAENWKLRAWMIPPTNEDTLLCNLHHPGEQYYFGDLTLYSRGFMQALIKEIEDAPVLEVEQRPAPEGQEYIHSMMYWMAINNHVLIIQSHSLISKKLEEYLTWLLKDRTAAIDPAGQVILQAKFDSSEIGGDLEDIREIIVGGTPTQVASVAQVQPGPERPGQEIAAYREVAEHRTWAEKAREVLRAVMNNEADVNALLDSIPDEASLEVSVHIGYKTRKRRISRAPMQQALRNLPEGEVTAIGKTGKLTGKDLRLTYPASIRCVGSLLDPTDVVRAFRGAYNYFVENGKIDP